VFWFAVDISGGRAMNNMTNADQRYNVFDGHNDVLLDLFASEPSDSGNAFSFFERSNYRHLDLPRALDAGFLGGLFAIMVPSPKEKQSEPPEKLPGTWAMPYPEALDYRYSQSKAMAILDGIHRLEAESGGRIAIVRTVADIIHCFERGILGMGIHFEGAEPIAPDLDNLQEYYDQGLRSVGIVWSRPNAFAHGVPIRFPGDPDTGPGLTDAGKHLVTACNEMGVMLDLSHLNEKGFWDVEKLSAAPLVATHSNAHAICPNSRNLTDGQLDAIAASDGVVGINFAVYFLRPDGKPDAATPVETVIRHIDYIARRIGIDHVALGSDFNGALIPAELGDVMGLLRLIRALEDQGFSPEEIRKITSENWLRVLGRTWKDGM